MSLHFLTCNGVDGGGGQGGGLESLCLTMGLWETIRETLQSVWMNKFIWKTTWRGLWGTTNRLLQVHSYLAKIRWWYFISGKRKHHVLAELLVLSPSEGLWGDRVSAALVRPGGAVALPGCSLAASSPTPQVLPSPCPEIWLFLTPPFTWRTSRFMSSSWAFSLLCSCLIFKKKIMRWKCPIKTQYWTLSYGGNWLL